MGSPAGELAEYFSTSELQEDDEDADVVSRLTLQRFSGDDLCRVGLLTRLEARDEIHHLLVLQFVPDPVACEHQEWIVVRRL